MNESRREAHKSERVLQRGVSGPLVRGHDAGDTLIEILVAISILGLIGVALLGAFASNLAGSATYHNASAIEITLKNFAEAATEQIEYDPVPLFSDCATLSGVANGSSQIFYTDALSPLPGTALNFALPPNFTVKATVAGYYNDSTGQFDPSQSDCLARRSANSSLLDPQLVTISATGPNGANGTLQFVVASLNQEQL